MRTVKEKSLSLLIAPLGILLTGLGLLYMAPERAQLPSLLSLACWLGGLVVLSALTQLVIIRSTKGVEVWLLPMALTLLSLGLTMIARLEPSLLLAQIRWGILGIIAFVAALAKAPQISRWLDYQYILGLVCLILLGLPLVMGAEIGGSRNWLVFGSFSLQPSEFGKIVLVLFLAGFLKSHREVLSTPRYSLWGLKLPALRFIAPLLCIWGVAVLMFIVERDLGAALLFFGLALIMTYVATGSHSLVALALGFFVLSALASYEFFGHVRVRFDIWLDPWADPSGDAYQVVQSLFAFGSGGVWGSGFAHGMPDLIPAAHTDFIFAAIAEEFGLVGSVMVLSLYAIMFFQGVKIALAADREENVLLAAGISSLLLLQTFVIIAGVTKFLPLTGITLPFVSYGGSSLITSFMLLGLLSALKGKDKIHGRQKKSR